MAESGTRQNDWLQVRLTDGERRELETALGRLKTAQERLDALEREFRQLIERGKQAIVALDVGAAGRKPYDGRLLRDWQLTESRLFDASSRRLHDFERRLEHEWHALRQLHELPVKALEQRAGAAQELLARVEARLQSLESNMFREMAESSREVRETARSLREQLPRDLNPDTRPAHTIFDASEDGRLDLTEAVPTRRSSRLLWLALVAGLVGVALYAGYVHWQLAKSMDRVASLAAIADRRATEAQQTAATLAQSTAEQIARNTADAMAAAARAERISHVLAASDLRRYPLLGYRFAPAASGQALWSRSRGLVVTASQLSVAPSGQVYQAWVVTTRGSLSLGFVSVDAQNRVSVAFDIPPELPGSVMGFMVTLERAGGSAAPSSRVALAS